MKKILFAAFAASLLAAGCQKTEVYQPANSGEKMTFSTEMKKITKADESHEGLDSLQKHGFNVWAFADYDISTSANVTKKSGIFDGMENWHVGFANNTWSANKAFYWPGQDKQLHFFAVSGSRTKPSTIPENLKLADYEVAIFPKFSINKESTVTDDVAKMTISNYEVSPNADDDLMVADFLTQDQGSEVDGSKGKVALNFRHTLSKVQFVFKTIEQLPENTNVYIQKLTVTDLSYKGTLEVKASTAVTKADAITTTVEPKWNVTPNSTTYFFVESKGETNITEKIDYVKKTDASTNTTSNEYESVNGTLLTTNPKSDPLVTWLMMPQTIADASQIEVFYLINNRQFKAVFPLKRDNVKAWAVNTFTKYTITLSPNLITFDAGVSEDWEEPGEITDQN